MNLAQLALNNSRITIIGVGLLIVIGLSTYLSYPSAEDPTIQIRTASVTANYPGMPAERVEDLIAVPLEAAMREITEIADITSTSKTGAVRVGIEVREEVEDLEAVFQAIRNKVDDVKADLPEGTQGPFVSDEEGLTAVATIALWSDGFSMAEMHEVAEDAQELLYTLDGVRKIEIYGAQEERIFLEFNPVTLAQLDVSPQEIFSALAEQNIIEPGGEISAAGRRITLEPSGNLDSVDDIAAVVFSIPGTDKVFRLGEVVDIKRGYVDPPQTPAFFNDKPAIIISISTIEGTNNIAFGDELTKLVDEFEQTLPIGYVLDYATFQPTLIKEAVKGAVSNVYQTLGIVLAVVMVFLGIRTGLIVGSFVPMTMLLGIIVMRQLEVELQRMSIAAMIIALGLLVDNGIVVAEDIRVRMARGVERAKAAIESTKALALPLFTSSLTTIFAFLPMLLIEGGTGDYVRSLAQVVAILLLGSWLLAMTVTPAMCAWFLRVDDQEGQEDTEEEFSGKVYVYYRRVLELMLRFRVSVIVVMVLLFIGSVQLLGTLKTEFFPLGDRNQFLIKLDLEAGTDIRETQQQVRVLTKWLSDPEINPEITGNIAYVGFGGPRFFLALPPVNPDSQRGFVIVNTETVDDIGPVIERVNSFLDANLPTAQADAKRMWFGATEPGIVKIRLIGPNSDTLFDRGAQVVEAFHQIPGAVGIKHDWENKILKIIVEVDQVRARRAGVTSSNIAAALSSTFGGRSISDFRDGDKVIPIVVRGNEDLLFSLSGLENVRVYSPVQDTYLSLDQVAKVRGQWRFSRIERRNQERTLTVEARHVTMPSPMLFSEIKASLEKIDLPLGHRWEVGGEIEDQAEANEKLFGLLPMAMAGIIILLVGQFNSFRKGGIIVATIPLILIGGTVGLVIMNAPYGFMVLLGFFSLAGILINNGIVLIDRIQTEEETGKDPLEAVVSACLARLRPILMTTLTTVLGLIPLILFGGALFYGMASVIAFGLVFGTIFTLGFVPVLYTLLFRVRSQKVEQS